jgi:metal-dependent HD superfamily phosphatase/phosphodiesterase
MDQIYENELPSGITDELWRDESDGLLHFQSTQDVTAIVERNKALYNDAGERPQWGDGRVVAEIPMTLYDELQRKGITRDPKALHKWLMDPDNRAFRTMPGDL